MPAGKIFLFYFYDAYDVNLWEKMFGRSKAFHTIFIEFNNFMKK